MVARPLTQYTDELSRVESVRHRFHFRLRGAVTAWQQVSSKRIWPPLAESWIYERFEITGSAQGLLWHASVATDWRLLVSVVVWQWKPGKLCDMHKTVDGSYVWFLEKIASTNPVLTIEAILYCCAWSNAHSSGRLFGAHQVSVPILSSLHGCSVYQGQNRIFC